LWRFDHLPARQSAPALELPGQLVSLIVPRRGPCVEPDLARPFFIIWAIYLPDILLTDDVSNNAVVWLITPIAIGLAQAIGIDRGVRLGGEV